MMIYGIGTDIVEIARIQQSLERFGERFAKRILSVHEFTELMKLNESAGASQVAARFLARRFAAKEAVAKALGLGIRQGLAFNQIGISHDAIGKPEVVYSGAALTRVRQARVTQSLISLSDERDYAVAFAILTQDA